MDIKLPTSLPKSPLDDIKDSELTGHRKLVFSATAPGAAAHWQEYDFFIDDKKFEPTRIDQRVKLGSVEEWTIRTRTNWMITCSTSTPTRSSSSS
jgi:FtsP/CotA-like multicopper oxidase with cupredoxin domain